MFKRRNLALLAVIAMMIAACGGDGAESTTATTEATGTTAATTTTEATTDTTATTDDDLVIGISWNNYAQPRWAKADGPAIIAAVEAAGGRVLERDANDSSEQQLSDIDSLIAEGADALIILAKDSEAILTAVQKAKDAGIPVIGYDRLIEDTEAFYITFDNVAVGRIEAEVITGLAPEGNYAIVKGHSADPNADFLRGGMTPVLEPLEASGAITVVCEDYNDNWNTDSAFNMMVACLDANDGDIQAVISENDSMATGVVAALQQRGMEGTVPVAGQDGDTPALNRVALGTQAVSVWKDAFGLGQTAGEVAVQLAGGTALADIKAPSTLADHVAPAAGADAQPFTTPGGIDVWSIILTPVPITQDNINLVIDLGWETKDAVCAGVEAGSVTACA